MENSRLLSVSDGGSGGGGGYPGSDNGNFGGGGGDAGGGSSGNNWTLLSWYLSMLEKYPVITKAVTSALLTFLGALIVSVFFGPEEKFPVHLSGTGISWPDSTLLFVFSPIFIEFFLSTLMTLEGRPSEVVLKLQQEWFSAVLATANCGSPSS